MKYPIEVINVHESDPYNSQKKYRVYKLSIGAVAAAARASSPKSGLTVRHTGGYVQNGVPALNDATGKIHIDEEHKDQTDWLRYGSICDVTGNSLTEQLQGDITGRRAAHQASTVNLGSESFLPMVVMEAEVILRSKNKKAIDDPKANLVFVVKLKTWQDGLANKTTEYSQENDTLVWGSDGEGGKRTVNAANIDEVLEFVRGRIASLS